MQPPPYGFRPSDTEVLLLGPTDLQLPPREFLFEGEPGRGRVVGGGSGLNALLTGSIPDRHRLMAESFGPSAAAGGVHDRKARALSGSDWRPAVPSCPVRGSGFATSSVCFSRLATFPLPSGTPLYVVLPDDSSLGRAWPQRRSLRGMLFPVLQYPPHRTLSRIFRRPVRPSHPYYAFVECDLQLSSGGSPLPGPTTLGPSERGGAVISLFAVLHISSKLRRNRSFIVPFIA